MFGRSDRYAWAVTPSASAMTPRRGARCDARRYRCAATGGARRLSASAVGAAGGSERRRVSAPRSRNWVARGHVDAADERGHDDDDVLREERDPRNEDASTVRSSQRGAPFTGHAHDMVAAALASPPPPPPSSSSSSSSSPPTTSTRRSRDHHKTYFYALRDPVRLEAHDAHMKPPLRDAHALWRVLLLSQGNTARHLAILAEECPLTLDILHEECFDANDVVIDDDDEEAADDGDGEEDEQDETGAVERRAGRNCSRHCHHGRLGLGRRRRRVALPDFVRRRVHRPAAHRQVTLSVPSSGDVLFYSATWWSEDALVRPRVSALSEGSAPHAATETCMAMPPPWEAVDYDDEDEYSMHVCEAIRGTLPPIERVAAAADHAAAEVAARSAWLSSRALFRQPTGETWARRCEYRLDDDKVYGAAYEIFAPTLHRYFAYL